MIVWWKVVNEDGTEWPQVQQAVMGWSSWPDPELTALEAVMDRSSWPDPELTTLEAVMDWSSRFDPELTTVEPVGTTVHL